MDVIVDRDLRHLLPGPERRLINIATDAFRPLNLDLAGIRNPQYSNGNCTISALVCVNPLDAKPLYIEIWARPPEEVGRMIAHCPLVEGLFDRCRLNDFAREGIEQRFAEWVEFMNEQRESA